MMLLAIYMLSLFILSMMVMMIAQFITKKTSMDREKNSPFECGFDPKSSGRVPFSLQFFLIAIIFLIFDVELTLLMPLIYAFKLTNFINISVLGITFILILLLGLIHEWSQGALNWTK